MRKLIIATILTGLALISGAASLSASASVGDIVGEVAASDIVTYINGHPIPAYSLNGETAVRIADLNDYGFDVSFKNGISCADYNENKPISPKMRSQQPGLSVLSTDIEVQINGVPVPGYNIEGYMAVPIERACEAYLQINAENIYSPYALNYIWNSNERSLSLDISSDRVSYQDLMIDLIRAAKMDFGSNFYTHYVEPETTRSTEDIISRFSDISGTKLKPYVLLLSKAGMIDINDYNDDPIHPYRGSTMTDAAFLVSRILGCPADYIDAFEYFREEYYLIIHTESDIPDPCNYSDYEIAASDASSIPEWSRKYFAYLLDIGVIDINANGNLYPNAFLSKESEQQLIASMLGYMERGITDMDIDFVLYYDDILTDPPHKLTSPAQIIDNILYVPFYSLFNETYRNEHISDAGAYKFLPTDEPFRIEDNDLYIGFTRTFVGQYIFSGDSGYFLDVFPGLYGCITHKSSHIWAGSYAPFFHNSDHPILTLYGEPMMPVYDYSAGEETKFFDAVLSDKSYFDPDSNTLTFVYNSGTTGMS